MVLPTVLALSLQLTTSVVIVYNSAFMYLLLRSVYRVINVTIILLDSVLVDLTLLLIAIERLQILHVMQLNIQIKRRLTRRHMVCIT